MVKDEEVLPGPLKEIDFKIASPEEVEVAFWQPSPAHKIDTVKRAREVIIWMERHGVPDTKEEVIKYIMTRWRKPGSFENRKAQAITIFKLVKEMLGYNDED